MSSKLDELIAQKKEIEKQIRELTNPKYEVDGAKLYVRRPQGTNRSEWIVTLAEIDGVRGSSNGRNKEVAVAHDKEESLKYMQYLMSSLVTLYNEVSDSVMITLGVYPQTDKE